MPVVLRPAGRQFERVQKDHSLDCPPYRSNSNKRAKKFAESLYFPLYFPLNLTQREVVRFLSCTQGNNARITGRSVS